MRFTLKVKASARKTEFAGKLGDTWKLNVAAPPADGKANDAIIDFLAKLTGVHASAIRIVTGHSSNLKIIEIEGIDRAILETHGSGPNSGSAAARKA